MAVIIRSYIICSSTSAPEIYLVTIINNLGQGEAGLEVSYQENVAQVSERQLKNASLKSLEGKITLNGFFWLFVLGWFFSLLVFFWGRFLRLPGNFILPPLSKNEVQFSSGLSSDLFTHIIIFLTIKRCSWSQST